MTATMDEKQKDKSILHTMNSISASPSKLISSKNTTPIIAAIVVVLLGIGSGYGLSRQGGGTLPNVKQEVMQETKGEIKKGQIYGSSDEKAFRDSAEGTFEKGGLDGEGSHKLIRPGGESQTAYLTSSTLNLDQFTDRKVKVWGETFKAAKAGWFMDVGRVEILE